jgi:hypothetical protein
MSRLHLLSFPYPPYAWRIVRSGAGIWLLLHLALFFLGIVLPSPHAAIWLVAICGALVWLDARRFHEHLFHANLGASPLWTAALAAVTAGVLELFAQLALRSLGVTDVTDLFG